MHQFKTILLLMAIPAVLSLNGCKKDDDDDKNTGGGSVTVNSDPQSTFKVDGTSASLKTGVGGVGQYFFNDGEIATFPDSSESIYGSGFDKDNGNTPIIEFSKGTFKYTIPSDSAAFSNFFAPQSYSYSVNAEDGVKITWYDSNGDMWSTDMGSGNQSGSTFTIEDRRAYTFSGEKYVRIKASFNCTVYNGLGGSKTITDGVSVMDFWADY